MDRRARGGAPIGSSFIDVQVRGERSWSCLRSDGGAFLSSSIVAPQAGAALEKACATSGPLEATSSRARVSVRLDAGERADLGAVSASSASSEASSTWVMSASPSQPKRPARRRRGDRGVRAMVAARPGAARRGYGYAVARSLTARGERVGQAVVRETGGRPPSRRRAWAASRAPSVSSLACAAAEGPARRSCGRGRWRRARPRPVPLGRAPRGRSRRGCGSGPPGAFVEIDDVPRRLGEARRSRVSSGSTSPGRSRCRDRTAPHGLWPRSGSMPAATWASAFMHQLAGARAGPAGLLDEQVAGRPRARRGRAGVASSSSFWALTPVGSAGAGRPSMARAAAS